MLTFKLHRLRQFTQALLSIQKTYEVKTYSTYKICLQVMV